MQIISPGRRLPIHPATPNHKTTRRTLSRSRSFFAVDASPGWINDENCWFVNKRATPRDFVRDLFVVDRCLGLLRLTRQKWSSWRNNWTHEGVGHHLHFTYERSKYLHAPSWYVPRKHTIVFEFVNVIRLRFVFSQVDLKSAIVIHSVLKKACKHTRNESFEITLYKKPKN